MLAYARIALAKSRSKWAAWLSSQRLPSVISIRPDSFVILSEPPLAISIVHFPLVISTERSEWRNLFLPPSVISTEAEGRVEKSR